MRISPTVKGTLITTLDRNTALQILGSTSDWYRVLLPTGQTGYVAAAQLESIRKPLKSVTVATTTELLEEPLLDGTPINQVKATSKVDVLANYNNFMLVKLADGTLGWLPAV